MRGLKSFGRKGREMYLVPKGMAAYSNRFHPTWDRFGDFLQDNGFPEDSPTKNVADLDTFSDTRKKKVKFEGNRI
jgi:hypothetical protein